MNERDPRSHSPGPRHLVDKTDPTAGKIRQRLIKIGHFEGDVVQSRPTPVKETLDDSRPRRLQQLQISVSRRQHALDKARRGLLVGAGQPEHVFQQPRRVISMMGEGNVVQAGHPPMFLRGPHLSPWHTLIGTGIMMEIALPAYENPP